MQTMRLGRTELTVSRTGFGALPLQRLDLKQAVAVLQRAVDGGITFFDTARMYSDSETKLGVAFEGMRQKVVLATKTLGSSRDAIMADLENSLKELKTDYLDLYQFHVPKIVPLPEDGTERYETLAGLKEQGVIRALGITAHSLENAVTAVRSGLFDSVQYPFSLLVTPEEEAMVASCKEKDIGFIAMKGLAGGLITDIPAAFAHMRAHEYVLPIWGVQAMEELEEFLALEAAPPAWNAAMQQRAQKERDALGGSFCRGCGYCLPCPQDIDIPWIARMNRLLRRSPWQQYAERNWVEKLSLAKTCIECGDCATRCPYELNPAELVSANVVDYENFMREQGVSVVLG